MKTSWIVVLVLLVIIYIRCNPPCENMATIVNDTRTIELHYTNWCGACKRMKPVFERVKAENTASNIKFVEIDEDVAKNPNIAAYPTILMIAKNGRVSQYPGGADYVQLRNWVMSPIPYNK